MFRRRRLLPNVVVVRPRPPPVVVVRPSPPPVVVVSNPGVVVGHPQATVIEDIHGTKIRNPHVPFVATLVRGVHPGKKIIIEGRVDFELSKTIVVNLACGPAIEDNIALHISIRGKDGIVVINDRKYGHWGNEDRHVQSVACGMHIKLKIHAKSDHFKIKFNGRRLCTFHYRRAVSEVTHLKIEGGIHVHEVEIEKSKTNRYPYVATTVTSVPPTVAYQPPPMSYPPTAANPIAPYPMQGPALNSGVPIGMTVSAQDAAAAATVASRPSAPPMAFGATPPGFAPSAALPVPYITALPNAMTVGRQLHISGTPTLSAQEVVIILKAGPNIAFFVKVDFNQGVIIRNACPFGAWGAEERHLTSQFPFTRGHPFKVILFCDHDGYKMAVNGVHLVHFAHRVAFVSIDSFEIRGDLALASVEII